ncbi:MAG: hypothetical protein AVDCRST_MAG88-3802, partial [uncultured Thermomicrobiales bacterium]
GWSDTRAGGPRARRCPRWRRRTSRRRRAQRLSERERPRCARRPLAAGPGSRGPCHCRCAPGGVRRLPRGVERAGDDGRAPARAPRGRAPPQLHPHPRTGRGGGWAPSAPGAASGLGLAGALGQCPGVPPLRHHRWPRPGRRHSHAVVPAGCRLRRRHGRHCRLFSDRRARCGDWGADGGRRGIHADDFPDADDARGSCTGPGACPRAGRGRQCRQLARGRGR